MYPQAAQRHTSPLLAQAQHVPLSKLHATQAIGQDIAAWQAGKTTALVGQPEEGPHFALKQPTRPNYQTNLSLSSKASVLEIGWNG